MDPSTFEDIGNHPCPLMQEKNPDGQFRFSDRQCDCHNARKRLSSPCTIVTPTNSKPVCMIRMQDKK